MRLVVDGSAEHETIVIKLHNVMYHDDIIIYNVVPRLSFGIKILKKPHRFIRSEWLITNRNIRC